MRMAIPFLSSSVIRIVTERVLANVLEQLPKVISSPSAAAGESDLARANSVALQTLNRDLEQVRGSVGQLDTRIERLESRVSWRIYMWFLITGLIVYGIGFGTAMGLAALGVI